MSKPNTQWQDLPQYQREIVVSVLVREYDKTLEIAAHHREMRLDALADRMENNSVAFTAALEELGAQCVDFALAGGPDE